MECSQRTSVEIGDDASDYGSDDPGMFHGMLYDQLCETRSNASNTMNDEGGEGQSIWKSQPALPESVSQAASYEPDSDAAKASEKRKRKKRARRRRGDPPLPTPPPPPPLPVQPLATLQRRSVSRARRASSTSSTALFGVFSASASTAHPVPPQGASPSSSKSPSPTSGSKLRQRLSLPPEELRLSVEDGVLLVAGSQEEGNVTDQGYHEDGMSPASDTGRKRRSKKRRNSREGIDVAREVAGTDPAEEGTPESAPGGFTPPSEAQGGGMPGGLNAAPPTCATRRRKENGRYSGTPICTRMAPGFDRQEGSTAQGMPGQEGMPQPQVKAPSPLTLPLGLSVDPPEPGGGDGVRASGGSFGSPGLGVRDFNRELNLDDSSHSMTPFMATLPQGVDLPHPRGNAAGGSTHEGTQGWGDSTDDAVNRGFGQRAGKGTLDTCLQHAQSNGWAGSDTGGGSGTVSQKGGGGNHVHHVGWTVASSSSCEGTAAGSAYPGGGGGRPPEDGVPDSPGSSSGESYSGNGLCSEISEILSKTDDELLKADAEELEMESAYKAFSGATPSVELFSQKMRGGAYRKVIVLLGPYASLPPLPADLPKKPPNPSERSPPEAGTSMKAPQQGGGSGGAVVSVPLPFSVEIDKRLSKWRLMRFESQRAVSESLRDPPGDAEKGSARERWDESDPDDEEAEAAAAAEDVRVILNHHYVSYFSGPLLGGLFSALRDEGLSSMRAAFSESVYRRNPGLLCEIWRNCWPGQSNATSASSNAIPGHPHCRPLTPHILCKVLNDMGILLRVYTTNVDGLERAGGCPRSKLVELGGTFGSARCMECGKEHMSTFMKEKLQKGQRPICSFKPCKGLIKPDVVFAGGSRRVPHSSPISSDMDDCDCVLAVGLCEEMLPIAQLFSSQASAQPSPETPDVGSPPLHRQASDETTLSRRSASSKGSNGSAGQGASRKPHQPPTARGANGVGGAAGVSSRSHGGGGGGGGMLGALSVAKSLLQDVKEEVPRVFLGCDVPCGGAAAGGDGHRDLHVAGVNPEDAILLLSVASGFDRRIREASAAHPFSKRVVHKLEVHTRNYEAGLVRSNPKFKGGVLKPTIVGTSNVDFFPVNLALNARPPGHKSYATRVAKNPLFACNAIGATIHESPKKRESRHASRTTSGALRGIGAGDLNRTIAAPRSAPQGAKRSNQKSNAGSRSPGLKPLSAPTGSFVSNRKVHFIEDGLDQDDCGSLQLHDVSRTPSGAGTSHSSPQFLHGDALTSPTLSAHDLLSTPVLPPLGTPATSGLQSEGPEQPSPVITTLVIPHPPA